MQRGTFAQSLSLITRFIVIWAAALRFWTQPDSVNDECFKSCMPRLCEDGDLHLHRLLSVPFLRVRDNSLAFIHNAVDITIAVLWRFFLSAVTHMQNEK